MAAGAAANDPTGTGAAAAMTSPSPTAAPAPSAPDTAGAAAAVSAVSAANQGLTLLQISTQRKRFLWNRGCIYGLLRGYLRGIRGCLGCYLCQKRLKVS